MNQDVGICCAVDIGDGAPVPELCGAAKGKLADATLAESVVNEELSPLSRPLGKRRPHVHRWRMECRIAGMKPAARNIRESIQRVIARLSTALSIGACQMTGKPRKTAI